MLHISDNNIILTRGDTLTLTVALEQDGETYEIQEGDTLRFACSQGYLGEPAYVLKIEKQIPTDTLTFTVTAEETGALDYREYNYDVELTHDDGSVDTVISAKLKIIGEVK